MTGTELGHPIQLVVPSTGEILGLDAPSPDLARLLADLREHEWLLRETKRAVNTELLSRFDRSAKWTHRFEGGLKLVAPSPAPGEEWDALELRDALLGLVDQGVLAVEAVDAAVEPVVTYKVHAAGVKALRKLGEPVSGVVDAHCRPVEKERYVRVTRA